MGRDATRIVIAEPWAVLRRGLVGLVQSSYTVLDELADVTMLRTLVLSRPVDLVVVGDDQASDLCLLLQELRATNPDTLIVVLVDEVSVERLRAVLQAGARAVLSKRVDDTDLLDAIARVLDGDRVVDQSFLPLLFAADELEAAAHTPDALLTPREREVLGLLTRGLTNRQIAEELVVGESTVKTHLVRIYAKLEVEDRHRAVGRAVELGLLS